MPHIIEPPTRTLPPAPLPRIRWTVEQYECIAGAGVLPEKGYELLEGDIVEKASIKLLHARVITLLFALFIQHIDFALLLSAFSLWVNDETLPEPDFAVLNTSDPTPTARGYVQVADIRLLVEVSDATLARDLTTKAALYAQAGIGEYWVIDVVGRRLLIHGQPEADGYGQVTEYTDADTAAPRFDPTRPFSVAAILP